MSTAAVPPPSTRDQHRATATNPAITAATDADRDGPTGDPRAADFGAAGPSTVRVAPAAHRRDRAYCWWLSRRSSHQRIATECLTPQRTQPRRGGTARGGWKLTSICQQSQRPRRAVPRRQFRIAAHRRHMALDRPPGRGYGPPLGSPIPRHRTDHVHHPREAPPPSTSSPTCHPGQVRSPVAGPAAHANMNMYAPGGPTDRALHTNVASTATAQMASTWSTYAGRPSRRTSRKPRRDRDRREIPRAVQMERLAP